MVLSGFPIILAYPLYIDYVHYNKRNFDVLCGKDNTLFRGDVVLSGFPITLAYLLYTLFRARRITPAIGFFFNATFFMPPPENSQIFMPPCFMPPLIFVMTPRFMPPPKFEMFMPRFFMPPWIF